MITIASTSNPFRPIVFAALFTTLLIAAGRIEAQETGRCVSATVPGTIELPDGTIYADQSIRLCFSQRLSPVAGLHETRVGGTPIGIFVSRVERVEAEPGPPYLALALTARGRWRLEGYAVPTARGMVAFHLQPSRGLEQDPQTLTASAARPRTFVSADFTR